MTKPVNERTGQSHRRRERPRDASATSGGSFRQRVQDSRKLSAASLRPPGRYGTLTFLAPVILIPHAGELRIAQIELVLQAPAGLVLESPLAISFVDQVAFGRNQLQLE